MIAGTINPAIKQLIPNFKIGIIQYHDIVIGDSPQMLKGRFQLFLESLQLEDQSPSEIPGVKEFRNVFKSLNMDPSRYRPASESLLRRVMSGKELGFVNSAVDVNNLFSLRHAIPIGIYDLDQIDGPVEITLGASGDMYDALNGRLMDMEGKLCSKDAKGPFGSPIVDSKRSMITEKAANALQIVYLPPSLSVEQADQLLISIAKMFTQVHGGDSSTVVLE